MFGLDAMATKHLQACMTTVENNECPEAIKHGSILASSLIFKQPIVRESLLLSSASLKEASQLSYRVLYSLELIDETLARTLPSDFDYNSLLYGYIGAFYPFFYVERAREQGEKPSLSSLKLSTFEYSGKLESEEIVLHFSFADHRIPVEAIDCYRKCSLTLDHTNLTLYGSEELLLSSLQNVLATHHLSKLTIGDMVGKDYSTRTFSLKVAGLDGFFTAVSQLTKAGVKIDITSTQFDKLLSRDKRPVQGTDCVNRYLFFGSQTVEFNCYDVPCTAETKKPLPLEI